ncbi:hypothetical protein DYB37_005259 [Aphanomyces astaci]|uniref:Phosphotyrosine protein phosphatase I domain-containing protein n=1 Tax=Aphanomyces astaci TaxID=112090 RepID=A0A397B271_APHAT|nr:hypothetical protein DYB36_009474 [Aphanomyces astaci]RHY14011.1 hypothetical protein DYB25_001408 [Aphanomyces astaci]RHY43248.1 hypothetical protein DYB34_007916 [Aphanomyces astaci]RHY67501.1 hypothetical protein DYB30_003247 [Aphanomyces astaci]RHY70365.1 hypothetical protein DYB38_008260 [Aphanomyces astaci]
MTVGVLFVCLGNICRSPAAEGVFKAIVHKTHDTPGDFRIDSCGTGGGSSNWYKPNGSSYHQGESSDGRMKKEAKKRGYHLTSRSRPLVPDDLRTFDHIICMDGNNVRAVMEAAKFWGPDVLDLLEDACHGLYAALSDSASKQANNTAEIGFHS